MASVPEEEEFETRFKRLARALKVRGTAVWAESAAQDLVDIPTKDVYTCIMRSQMTTSLGSALPLLPCACANLRRATRIVTRMYNQELRETGLELTQFTLLMALNLTGEITQGNLGELLALDTTS